MGQYIEVYGCTILPQKTVQNRNSHQSQQDLVIPSVNSVLKGKNSLRYFGSVIWKSLPNEMRNSETQMTMNTTNFMT